MRRFTELIRSCLTRNSGSREVCVSPHTCAFSCTHRETGNNPDKEMELRGPKFLLVAALLTLTHANVISQPTNRWSAFAKADGLAENACLSVTPGAGGDILVRHPNSTNISLLDGYEVATLPGPGTNRNRVYESPGGQLWTVAAEGLLELRDG